MESYTKLQICSKLSEHLIPKFALKPWIVVRNDHFWEAIDLEDLVNEQEIMLLCCNIFPTSDKYTYW